MSLLQVNSILVADPGVPTYDFKKKEFTVSKKKERERSGTPFPQMTTKYLTHISSLTEIKPTGQYAQS